jgi:chemotaxis family two-component system response regulator Rcp1
MSTRTGNRPIEILLVEDNLGDARLTQEALKEGKVRNNLYHALDGVEAMRFLLREGEHKDKPRPDLVLLDLNLPRKDGREVLADMRANPELKTIPVVVLTTSEAEQDVVRTYELCANCYITKPVDLDEFFEVVGAIKDFWLASARLPSQ